MELKQLDIFDYSDIEKDIKNISTDNEELTKDSIESHIVVAYETGDLVKLVFPTEEQDFELYNYLEHYYSHLKNKKGRIVQVMPYKKLQYQIEFDVKNDDNRLIMYHSNLEWIGK